MPTTCSIRIGVRSSPYEPGNRLNAFRMSFQGLDQQQAEIAWKPFFEWVMQSPADLSYRLAPRAIAAPARHLGTGLPEGVCAPGRRIVGRPLGSACRQYLLDGKFGRGWAFPLWLPIGVVAACAVAGEPTRRAGRCTVRRRPSVDGRTAHAKGTCRRVRSRLSPRPARRR